MHASRLISRSETGVRIFTRRARSAVGGVVVSSGEGVRACVCMELLACDLKSVCMCPELCMQTQCAYRGSSCRQMTTTSDPTRSAVPGRNRKLTRTELRIACRSKHLSLISVVRVCAPNCLCCHDVSDVASTTPPTHVSLRVYMWTGRLAHRTPREYQGTSVGRTCVRRPTMQVGML